MKFNTISDDELQFEAFKRNVEFWANINPEDANQDDMFSDESHALNSDILLPNLLHTADQYLQKSNAANLLELNHKFILRFLSDEVSRINKMLQDNPEVNAKALMDKCIRAMEAPSANDLIKLIMIVDHLIFSVQFERSKKIELLKQWVFVILAVINKYNPRPSKEEQQANQFKKQFLYLLLSQTGYYVPEPQRPQLTERELFAQYLSDNHQTVVHLIRSLRSYIIFIGDANIKDEGDDSILHYLAGAKFVHAEFAELLKLLLENDIDYNAENKNGFRPIQLALRNKFSTDVLEILGTKHTINELESLVLHELGRDDVDTTAVFFLINQLAANAEWSNYSLVMLGQKLWSNKCFVNLNLAKNIANFVYACHAPLPDVLTQINNTYGNATIHIGSCIAYLPKTPNGNILRFLVDNPAICAQLNTPSHYSILECILFGMGRKNSSWNNLNSLCRDTTDNVIAAAVESKNLSMLLLIYRLAKPTKLANKLCQAMQELIKQQVDTHEVVTYLQPDKSCTSLIFSDNSTRLLKQVEEQKRSKPRPVLV